MKTNFSITMLLEAVCLNIIIVLLIIAGFFMPSIMACTIIFSAAVVAMLTVRTNMKVVFFSLPILYITVFLLVSEPISAGISILSFYFAGIAIGYGLKNKWDYKTILVATSAAYLFPILAVIVIYNWIENVNQIEQLILQPLNHFLDQMKQDMNDVFKMYKNFGIIVDESVSLTVMNKAFEMIKNMISILIPGFFIIFSAGFSFITLAVSRFILKRRGYHYNYLPLFYELKVNKGTVAAFGISLLLSMLIDNYIISAALINITFILFIVISLCGISVLDYFIHRARIPGILRIMIYILLMVILSIMSIVMPMFHPIYFFAIISLGDSIFDFRKLKNKGEHYEQ